MVETGRARRQAALWLAQPTLAAKASPAVSASRDLALDRRCAGSCVLGVATVKQKAAEDGTEHSEAGDDRRA